jgi:hypothetical protein
MNNSRLSEAYNFATEVAVKKPLDEGRHTVLHAFEFAICVIRSDSKRQNNDLAWTLSD